LLGRGRGGRGRCWHGAAHEAPRAGPWRGVTTRSAVRELQPLGHRQVVGGDRDVLRPLMITRQPCHSATTGTHGDRLAPRRSSSAPWWARPRPGWPAWRPSLPPPADPDATETAQNLEQSSGKLIDAAFASAAARQCEPWTVACVVIVHQPAQRRDDGLQQQGLRHPVDRPEQRVETVPLSRNGSWSSEVMSLRANASVTRSYMASRIRAFALLFRFVELSTSTPKTVR
jgi:hypothetical protein